MSSNKSSIRNVFFSLFFCLLTILFAGLYHFKVLSRLDEILTLTYCSYFIGLAFAFNHSFLYEKGKKVSANFNLTLSILLSLFAISLLVYGLITGQIEMF